MDSEVDCDSSRVGSLVSFDSSTHAAWEALQSASQVLT